MSAKNNNKKNTTNGNPNLLTPQQEAMRAEVVERELRARYAKANWEIVHYSLETEKLQPEYQAYVQKEQAKIEEQKKQYEDFINGIQSQAAAAGLTDADSEAPVNKAEDAVQAEPVAQIPVEEPVNPSL